MKHLFAIFLLFISLNCFSQTTATLGTGGFNSFAKGEESPTFKLIAISQLNHTFGRLTLSAVTVATVDSTAAGFIGTGAAFGIYQNTKDTLAVLLGVDLLKGEKKAALFGGGVSIINKKTVYGIHYQREISEGKDWIGFTIQQIVF